MQFFNLCRLSPLELRVWREPDLHPVHHTLSGQTGSAAARGHQGGVRPGRLLDGSVGPHLRGGPPLPGPQAHLKGQQKHRGTQGQRTVCVLGLQLLCKAEKRLSSSSNSRGKRSEV